MLKKHITIIIFLIIIILILSGCWNRFEPKGLAFSTSVLYDKTDNEQYEVIIEFLNPTASSNGSKGGNGGSNKTIITTFSANSVGEAIRKNSTTIDRVLYLAHNRARFFSEKLAREDIIPLIDLFIRDRQSRQSVYMSVIKGDDPKLIYSADTGLSDTVGDYIEALEKSQAPILTESVYYTLLDFMKDYYEDGKQPVLGAIEIIEDAEPVKKQSEPKESPSSASEKPKTETKYKIKYEGLAAFKEGKLVGFMDVHETRAYNIIVNKFIGSIISIPYKERKMVFNVGSSKTQSKTSMDENGQISIDVSIKIGVSLSEAGGTSDVSKFEVMNELKQNFNHLIEEQVSDAIKKAQTEFKSDIFGFGLRMHEQNPKEWEKCKDNWDECFATAKINVKVESAQIGAGVTKQPFKLEF